MRRMPAPGAGFGVHPRGCTPSYWIVPELQLPGHDWWACTVSVEKGPLAVSRSSAWVWDRGQDGTERLIVQIQSPQKSPFSPEWKGRAGGIR